MSMLYITFMGGPRFLLDGADVSDQISSKAANRLPEAAS